MKHILVSAAARLRRTTVTAKWPTDFWTSLCKTNTNFRESTSPAVRGSYEGDCAFTVTKSPAKDQLERYNFVLTSKNLNLEQLAAFIRDTRQTCVSLKYKEVKNPKDLRPKTFLLGRSSSGMVLMVNTGH